MDTDRRRHVREVFMEAAEAADGEREAVLDRLCGGDVELRREVERLLSADREASAGGFMSEPTASVARSGVGAGAGAELTEAPGARIGAYKLLQKIGEGGFGVVFMAEQEQPVRRRVALKVIKLGMDTKQVVARFEQERQALALMDHPHIAKVFDAGATPVTDVGGGRPYFVMEYVTGEPITEFADAHKLSVAERLALFTQVCSAVQHAHTKGVIHRDLKPRNVLVSVVDGRPHAKVIDFGIAKATGAAGGRLTERTLFTEHRQLIGTLEYMSPEQAEGSPDIDTRTDVYSLGVVLYELLTGATPFDAARLRSAAWGEMQRIIKEEEPPAPSVRISKAEARGVVAAARGAEPAKLGTMVRGELDWIVMKALDKNRGRRYESPSQLAADVQRHLAGEAVVAAPASAGYRVRKFVRRHRGAVMASGAVGIALLLGMVGTTWQARIAVRERNSADAANQNYIRERKDLVRSYLRVLEGAGYKEVGFDERGLVTWLLPDDGGPGFTWITSPPDRSATTPMSEWRGDYLRDPLSFNVPAQIEETLGLVAEKLRNQRSQLTQQRDLVVGTLNRVLVNGMGLAGAAVAGMAKDDAPKASFEDAVAGLEEIAIKKMAELEQANAQLAEQVKQFQDESRGSREVVQLLVATLGEFRRRYAPEDGDRSFSAAIEAIKPAMPGDAAGAVDCGSCAMIYFMGHAVGGADFHCSGPVEWDASAEASLEFLATWTEVVFPGGTAARLTHELELARVQRNCGRVESALVTLDRAAAACAGAAPDSALGGFGRKVVALRAWFDMDVTTLKAGHARVVALRAQFKDRGAVEAAIEEEQRKDPELGRACRKYFELWDTPAGSVNEQ